MTRESIFSIQIGKIQILAVCEDMEGHVGERNSLLCHFYCFIFFFITERKHINLPRIVRDGKLCQYFLLNRVRVRKCAFRLCIFQNLSLFSFSQNEKQNSNDHTDSAKPIQPGSIVIAFCRETSARRRPPIIIKAISSQAYIMIRSGRGSWDFFTIFCVFRTRNLRHLLI